MKKFTNLVIIRQIRLHSSMLFLMKTFSKHYRFEDENQVNKEYLEMNPAESDKVSSNSFVELVDLRDGRVSRSQTPPSRRDSIVTTQSNASSKIPRYIRNTTVSNTSNSNSNVASTVSSPVQRKLLTKQQGQKYNKRGQEDSERNLTSNHLVEGI